MSKNLLLPIILLFLVLIDIPAQTGIFNLDEYKSFLNTHKNLTTDQLVEMHPAGSFRGNINLDAGNIFYFDSISGKYNLTEFEKSLINKNGFMVSERLSQGSFGEILLDIHHNDLPVFVSTDAILYAFHASYDRILQDVEVGFLINKISVLLETLRSQVPALESKYNTQPGMKQMLKDVDLYLTVAAKLLGEDAAPFYTDNAGKIDYLLGKIFQADGFGSDTIFSSNCVTYDWSQFKPRGHYDTDELPELRNYFRAMIWLGRVEIYLIAPPLGDVFCPAQTFADIQRQCIDALLICELFEMSASVSNYEEIESVIKFFVGDQDNVTLPDLFYLKNAASIASADELLDSLKLNEFQDTLKNQSFAYQLIVSQILAGTWSAADSIVPASSFLLFGQRYVDDSYVTAQVVYDRIEFNNEKICRLFPSALDPMFALGNDAAAQLLIPELNSYHYSSNLAALRYLFNGFTPEYWNSSLYRQWLNVLRKLNPPEDKSSLPPFMNTGAFWQQKLNTQLASWAQLRHDNLLYAKQSYTGVPICSYPYSYVEPFPEFFEALVNIGSAGYNYFQGFNLSDFYLKTAVLEYFTSLQTICDTLRIISQKELDDIPLTEQEISFLKNMMFEVQNYAGSSYKGWYPKLLYRDSETNFTRLMGKDYLIADIHTTPSDCLGAMHGWVKHVGTGPVDMGVFVAKIPGGQWCAFTGPLLSFRDYTTSGWLRLTDQEWNDEYLFYSTRPDWVNIYLADSSGNSRGPGLQLITSVENNKNKIIPSTQLIARNYPNPFNPSTIISFSIPYDLTNSKTELIVYNIQGEVVKRLVDETLPSGNYLTRWDGRNDLGNQVTSGIYIYSLRVADKQFSGKMTLLK